MNELEEPTSAEHLEDRLECAHAAFQQGDMTAALAIWAALRRQYTGHPTPLHRAGAALLTVGRLDEAQALLAEGRDRFPDDLPIAADFATVAERRGDYAAAAERWTHVRAVFPDHALGWIGGGLALRELRRFAEADALLADAAGRFVDDARPAIEHAILANVQWHWPEAIRRWTALRERFPDEAQGFTGAAWALREQDRLDEAEQLLSVATTCFPGHPDVAVEQAMVAQQRQDWFAASERWRLVRLIIPLEPRGYMLGADALRRCGAPGAADRLIGEAMARFADNPTVFTAYAEAAEQRGDWATALPLWQAAQHHLPLDRVILGRLSEARMRLAEIDPEAPALNDPGAGFGDSEQRRMHAIMMDCESLGGTLLGCEFGGIQRAFGAEPLGLLRWAEMSPHDLFAGLEARFDGVGSPEQTELFVKQDDDRREWRARDRRFYMEMHSFVAESATPRERMFANVCRRLQYLRRKLVDDLDNGAKLFVFKITARNLDEAELDRLYAAIRGYPRAMLLYVRYQDAGHPNGTVELPRPGLMLGYIDHFGVSPDEQELQLSITSWATICGRAHELWRATGVHDPAAA